MVVCSLIFEISVLSYSLTSRNEYIICKPTCTLNISVMFWFVLNFAFDQRVNHFFIFHSKKKKAQVHALIRILLRVCRNQENSKRLYLLFIELETTASTKKRQRQQQKQIADLCYLILLSLPWFFLTLSVSCVLLCAMGLTTSKSSSSNANLCKTHWYCDE